MPIDPRDVEICIQGPDPGDVSGAAAPPIAQTALFVQPTFQQLVTGLNAEHEHRVYTRGCNPTVEHLEEKIAALERGEACRCFGSGMAAISSVLLGVLKAGDHVVFANQIYGPTLELAEHLTRFGITYDVVLDLDPAAVERRLTSKTRMLWIESPGTMLFRTLDLVAMTELAKSRQILTVMDNSWATPLFQKPLTQGIDLVVHACSKYLGGHSDVIAGAVVGSRPLMKQIFYRALLLNGGILAPFDAWLILRGLRTLPVRMRQHRDDALAVARWLEQHPKVRCVHHPALSGSPTGAANPLIGTSGLFSFELTAGGFETVSRVIDALCVFRIAVSWGGPESLVISPDRPDSMHSSAQGIDVPRQPQLPTGLIRLSIGLEGADTLIQDLEAALSHA